MAYCFTIFMFWLSIITYGSLFAFYNIILQVKPKVILEIAFLKTVVYSFRCIFLIMTLMQIQMANIKVMG